MRVFIINLPQNDIKKGHMKQQMEFAGIEDYRFIEAIAGINLADEFIDKNVLDFPKCALTKGEVGCALSHIKVYREMIKSQVPYAMILEDDVLLPENLKAILEVIKDNLTPETAKVISFAKALKITRYKDGINFGKYAEYRVLTGFGGYAYIITLAGAENLVRHLFPIRYEADMFMHFRENGWLQEFNVIHPQCIQTIENHDDVSDLHSERRKLKRARHQYKKYTLLKQRPLKIRLKNRLYRAFWKFRQIRVPEDS